MEADERLFKVYWYDSPAQNTRSRLANNNNNKFSPSVLGSQMSQSPSVVRRSGRARNCRPEDSPPNTDTVLLLLVLLLQFGGD